MAIQSPLSLTNMTGSTRICGETEDWWVSHLRETTEVELVLDASDVDVPLSSFTLGLEPVWVAAKGTVFVALGCVIDAERNHHASVSAEFTTDKQFVSAQVDESYGNPLATNGRTWEYKDGSITQAHWI